MWPTRSSSRLVPANVRAAGFVACHSVMMLWYVTSDRSNPGGMKCSVAGLPRALRMGGVEQAVTCEVRMKLESDEPTG